MNYRIKITPDNREAIKDIANRNGMNKSKLDFTNQNAYYLIENNKINGSTNCDLTNYQDLTFEQFKEMFDNQETELDKWIKETKAKNLSLDELAYYISDDTTNYNIFYQLEGDYASDKAQILFNQWNETKPQGKIIGYKAPFDLFGGSIKKGHLFAKTEEPNKWYAPQGRTTQIMPQEVVETWEPVFEDTPIEFKEEMLGEIVPPNKVTIIEKEWQPKRGDRVLVWDDNEERSYNRIFVAEVKGAIFPFVTVHEKNEIDFTDNLPFTTEYWSHMKPLPIEQSEVEPEKSYKDKVIKVIKSKIEVYKRDELLAVSETCYDDALVFKTAQITLNRLIEEINLPNNQ